MHHYYWLFSETDGLFSRTVLLLTLDVSDDVALLDLGALLGVDLNELAAQGCLNLNKLAPRSLNPAEGVAFLILLADERLNRGSTLALAVELPEDLTLDRSNDGIGLGVLERAELLE